jgi:hypothetical protein
VTLLECRSARGAVAGYVAHEGPARELWVRDTPHLEMAVAFAIRPGLRSRETIPAELLEHLAGALRFYEEEQATMRRSGEC